MSDAPKAKHSQLEAAIKMGEHGLRVVPIGVGQKFPPIQEWQKQATSDAEVFGRWFASHPEWGLGWKMGAQTDGRYLVAIDVDVKSGGVESLGVLLDSYDVIDEFMDTVRARTGGGGMHYVFEFDETWVLGVGLTNRAKLMPGIDIRAEAGQIVVYPTIHPETGELYYWADGHAPWQIEPKVASDVLCLAVANMLTPAETASAPAPAAREHTRSTVNPRISAADWVRDHLDWAQALQRHGWTEIGPGEWKRPGKKDRGKSAVLHDGGPLVVFSTDVPPELASVGRPTKDGSGFSVSLFDFLAAYEARGDKSAYARQVYEEYGLNPTIPASPVAVAGGGDDGLGSQAGEAAETNVLHLSDWFWESRPVLGLIRDAARQRMVSPDALFLNVLLRWAALVPPSYKLPAVIGDEATFDLIGVVVANTSGGKSAAGRVSRQLVRNLDPAVMFDYPLGSGEGLVSSFMEMVERENPDTGKKERSLQVTKRALHFTIDEGIAFLGMAERKGTTIMPTLTSAWSGSALGQANASAETRRIIEGGRVRLAAAINMQESNAWKLFSPEISDLGLTGRFIFASAHDAEAEELEWDELRPLPFPPLTIIESGRIVRYDDPAIPKAIRARHLGILRGDLKIDPLESHQMLIRCKVAGILALQDARMGVSSQDWDLAGEVVRCSSAVLRRLQTVRGAQLSEIARTAVTAAAAREVGIDDAKERRAIDRMAEAIVARIGAAEEPLSVGKLARLVSNSGTRHRFEDALAIAVERGLASVVEDGENRHVVPPQS